MKTPYLLVLIALASHAAEPTPEATEQWTPIPPVVQTPANAAPSDATVLFSGTDLQEWQAAKGGPALWKVSNGSMVVAPGSGDIVSKRSFGDVQLHLEFKSPTPSGEGQDRGNSGVFLMGLYEVQVLDSYQSKTYVNGQAASLYKQFSPLVNASRAPGEWQTYDILFFAPRFGSDPAKVDPARATVFHNGVLVQNDVKLRGPTVYVGQPAYKPHAAKLPLSLQDHGHLVAFRNIWVRPIQRPE